MGTLLLNACSFSFEVLSEQTSTPDVTDIFTPVPQGLESIPTPTDVSETVELSLSDSNRLGFCFSYPLGYTQIPYYDAVEITAPNLPDNDVSGLFWLEIRDSQNRTAEEIADQEVAYVAGLNPGRWTVTLGGEQAIVIDGMPGQDLVRRVYIVHQQTLYILTFSPTRLENSIASGQMEILYTAVTSSWVWSPCSGGE